MKRDLSSTFVVLQPDQAMALVDVTPTVFEDLDRRTWEMHPAGDKLVCLLSGEAKMVPARAGGEEVAHLRKGGEYIVIPKGTWHTARTSVPTKMLFLTPGEGTQNRPV